MVSTVKRKTFLIGDLHLDHKNIIKYCNRPFKSVEEMNNLIVSNWNNAVGKDDIVYFLGDLAFGAGSRGTDFWAGQLNGEIIFIKGNHDRSKKISFLNSTVLEYKGKRFFLTHDPKNFPKNWEGWKICGHHHNNYPDESPFINGKTKTINVSVELLGYRPLDIDLLFELDFENVAFMRDFERKPTP